LITEALMSMLVWKPIHLGLETVSVKLHLRHTKQTDKATRPFVCSFLSPVCPLCLWGGGVHLMGGRSATLRRILRAG